MGLSLEHTLSSLSDLLACPRSHTRQRTKEEEEQETLELGDERPGDVRLYVGL